MSDDGGGGGLLDNRAQSSGGGGGGEGEAQERWRGSKAETAFAGSTLREVSLVQYLCFRWKHRTYRKGICLGDVDNDGHNELVLGSLGGVLLIWKGDNPRPWKTCEGLGTIGCLAVGDLYNQHKNVLVATTFEGQLHVFELEEEERVAITPTATHAIPPNVCCVLVVSVGKGEDRKVELLVGTTDRHVYRLELCYDPLLFPLKKSSRLNLKADWHFSQQAWLPLEEAKELSRRREKKTEAAVVVGLEGGCFEVLLLSSQQQPQSLFQPQRVLGSKHMSFCDGDGAGDSALSQSLHHRHHYQSFVPTEVLCPVVSVTPSMGSSLCVLTATHAKISLQELRPKERATNNNSSSVDGSSTDSGVGSCSKISRSDCAFAASPMWDLPLTDQIFAVGCVDLLGNASSPPVSTITASLVTSQDKHAGEMRGKNRDQPFVLCSWSGTTYICHYASRRIARFHLPSASGATGVHAFCCGKYSVEAGKSTNCLVYVTLEGEVRIYYDIKLRSLFCHSLASLLPRGDLNPFAFLLSGRDDATEQRSLVSSCLYDYPKQLHLERYKDFLSKQS
ncbi:integrin alpha FG-GAP repeat-containing protein 2 [Balamuthia mandrillaris]